MKKTTDHTVDAADTATQNQQRQDGSFFDHMPLEAGMFAGLVNGVSDSYGTDFSVTRAWKVGLEELDPYTGHLLRCLEIEPGGREIWLDTVTGEQLETL